MRKVFILTALFAIAGMVASAQQKIRSENIEAYNALEFTGNLTVELTKAQGDSKIDITLYNAEIDRLDWGVRPDGVLFVRLKPNSGKNKATAEVKLDYDMFTRMKISGANVMVKGVLQGGMVDIDMSSGGTLGSEVDVKDLFLKAGGNSAADIKGKAKYYTLQAAGRSKVDSRGLESMDVDVSASSYSEVYVRSQERLQISSETGANVFYAGEPEILRTHTGAMGEVNFIGK